MPDRLKENVKKLLEAGVPEPEIGAFIKKYSKTDQQYEKIQQSQGGDFVSTAQGNMDMSPGQSEMPRMVGSTAGGIGGTMVGGAPGGVAGSMLGGALGEGYQQLRQKATGSEYAPQGAMESVERMGKAGTISGAEDVVGLGLFKGVGKVIAPFKKYVTKEGVVAKNVLDKYMPKGTPAFMPAEMTEHRGLDILHNIAEKSMFGGKRIAVLKDITRPEAINSMLDDLTSTFGKNVDGVTLGNTVADIASGKWKTFKKVVTEPIYNTIEDMTENSVKISIKSLKDAANKKVLLKVGGESAGDDMVKAVKAMPDEVDFATANELRKRLIGVADSFSVTNKKAPAIGIAKHFTQLTDDAIEAGLKAQDKEAYTLWRKANDLYKKGNSVYNNRAIRGLIKQAEDSPEKVLKTIFTNGGVTTLRRVRKVVGEETWGDLQNWYLRDVLNKSVDSQGIIKGTNVLTRLYKKSAGMGEEALKEIYSPTQLKRINEVATAMKVSQQRQGEGAGGMLIQLMQAPAVAGLMFAPQKTLQTASAAVLVGPPVMARMMTSEWGAKWLSTGFKARLNSPLYYAAIARITNHAMREAYKERRSNENGSNR